MSLAPIPGTGNRRDRGPSFHITTGDHELILRIIDRAFTPLKGEQDSPMLSRDQRFDMMMSIVTCHANGCPLRLTDLLNADDFSFRRDVLGIANNIDTSTGRLDNCFRPRYAVTHLTRKGRA